MAPRCLTSACCLIELEYARILGKRVIPIYTHHEVADPNLTTVQAVLERSLSLIGYTPTGWMLKT